MINKATNLRSLISDTKVIRARLSSSANACVGDLATLEPANSLDSRHKYSGMTEGLKLTRQK